MIQIGLKAKFLGLVVIVIATFGSAMAEDVLTKAQHPELKQLANEIMAKTLVRQVVSSLN